MGVSSIYVSVWDFLALLYRNVNIMNCIVWSSAWRINFHLLDTSAAKHKPPNRLPQCFLASKWKIAAEFFSMLITLYSLAEMTLFGFLYKPPHLSASLLVSLPLAAQNWTWHNALPDISGHAAVSASVCSYFPRIQQPAVSSAVSVLLPKWDIRSKCHLLFYLNININCNFSSLH